MNALEFWRAVGTEKARKAAEAAGTEWSYFKHIAHNRKRPGVDLARRLIVESRKVSAELNRERKKRGEPLPHKKEVLTLEELLPPNNTIKGREKLVAAA